MSRGYFAIGAEGISKPLNVGNLIRSAHSFGAQFFFTIQPNVNVKDIRRFDTSDAFTHLPYYQYESAAALELPRHCQLVGVEFIEDSVNLPSFCHPLCAAYILGPEMGSLSPEVLARCDHVIKIPMKFCINVGVAGALVMYDRLISRGQYPSRPARAGGPDPADIKKPERTGHRRFVRTVKQETLSEGAE